MAISLLPATLRAVLNTDSAQQNHSASGDGISTVAVLTAVLWLGCVLVGALGFVMPYSRPRPPSPPAPVVIAQLMKVELTTPPATPPVIFQALPPLASPPPLAAAAVLPAAPQFLAVGQPSLAAASAPPIEAPARIVDVNQAAVVRPTLQSTPVVPSSVTSTRTGPRSPVVAPEPTVQTLTFGEGEGTQPAPHYPDAARRAGQEGTVTVRLSVGTDGRVSASEASAPSPWNALNREALRVVREQWRFPPGPERRYEVPIRFELRK